MVPKDWVVAIFNDLVKGTQLGTVERGINEIDDTESIPLIKMGNLGWGSLHFHKLEYIEQSRVDDSLLLKKGDFLFNTRNTPELVGKSAVWSEEYPATFDNNINRIEFKQNVKTEYLCYYLNYGSGKSIIQSLPAGSTSVAAIYWKDLKNIKIVLPSYPEQKKIAQILSAWDNAISVTKKLLINSQQQKKALMQQLLTGKKRLLDENGMRFSGEWVYLTFDTAFNIKNKKSAQVKLSDYLQSGSVPIIDQGQKIIAGYCNNAEVYSDVPVIVFGDHTRCIKWIDFVFCPGADGVQVIKTSKKLAPKFGYYLISNTEIPNLGYSRHMRELKEKNFRLPLDINEQQKIAAVLSAADAEIATLEKKLACLKDEKKALMQQLLTGKRRVMIDAV